MKTQEHHSTPPPIDRSSIWFRHVCINWLSWYNSEVEKIDRAAVFHTFEEKMGEIEMLQKTLPVWPEKPKSFFLNQYILIKAKMGNRLTPSDLLPPQS